MRKIYLLILFVLILAIIACDLPEGTKEIAELKIPPFSSQVGGEIRTFVARGDYIYIGSGPHVIIVDQSDPTKPYLIGESVVLPDIVQDIALQDNFAYVAAGKGGLRILDISDPDQPKVVGHMNWDGFAAYVVVDGDTAYVAGNEADKDIKGHGLRVINVKNRKEPKEVALLNTDGFPNFLAFYDDKIYLQQMISEDNKNALYLTTIDVSNKNKPVVDENYRLIKDAGDISYYPMDMFENLAFVVSKGELKIFNMDDPADPDLLGEEDLPMQPCGIALSENYVYVVSQRAGMAVVDIGNRSDPEVKGQYYQSAVVNCVIDAEDNLVYVDRYNGLELIDTEDSEQPIHSSIYKSPVIITDAAVDGDFAYVVSAEAKFHIIRIADAIYPEWVGFLDAENQFDPSSSFDVADPIFVEGDRAYTGSNAGSLAIIDISDKKNPVKEGFFTYPSGVLRRAYDLLISGDYAYLAAGTDGLLIINISDVANPKEEAILETSSPIRHLDLLDNTLFAAARGKGLLSIDISDPGEPDEFGGLTDKLFAGQVFVRNKKYAYVAGDDNIVVLDISDHDSPDSISTYKLDSSPLTMLLHGDKIYLVDAARNLITLKIRSDENFDELSRFELPCSAVNMTANNNFLYIVARKCGMFIIALSELD